MFTKFSTLSKKMLLAVMVLAIGLAAIPFTSAHAEGLNQDVDNSRLEARWAKLLTAYNNAETRLTQSDEFIAKVQELINKANAKGLDTSAVQAALDAFQSAIQDARPILNSANGIVNSHKGFDDSGKVTDRAQAIETAKELAQHLKDAHTAMNGTGKALRDAINAFREANRPAAKP